MSIFNSIFVKKPGSSKQNLSHSVKLTTDFGKLIPILVEDVLPGDRIRNLGAGIYLQMLPMLAPILDDIEVRVDFFFVPNRLLWSYWQDFITRGPEGTTDLVKPYITFDQLPDRSTWLGIGSLWDYMGLPPDIPSGVRSQTPLYVNTDLDEIVYDALPFRAYSLIYSEFYRDQNLDPLGEIKYTGPGSDDPDNIKDHPLRYVNLKKDYFTSALPWAQRGPEVSIPLSPGSSTVPMTGNVNLSGQTDPNNLYYSTDPNIRENTWFAGSPYFSGNGVEAAALSNDIQENFSPESSANRRSSEFKHTHGITGTANITNGTVDLSEASGVTINELRRLTSVQRWLERNARAGSRYIEQILSHFGVRTPDFRLDRPEYLGGTKNWIGISKVLQTSESSSNSPLGDFAGHGQMVGRAMARNYRVDEHGWIIGLMCIRPKNIYSDGVARMFTRQDTFDYYFPEFQMLGEQAILNKEIFAYGNGQSADVNGTFGYTPRYAEYKYHPSQVRGEMRNSLYYWHLGRFFNSKPSLNQQFIGTTPSLQDWDRIFPVLTDQSAGNDHFIVNLAITEHLRRPMYKNPNPKL